MAVISIVALRTAKHVAILLGMVVNGLLASVKRLTKRAASARGKLFNAIISPIKRLEMTSQAALSLRASAALHVGMLFLVVLAGGRFVAELPHPYVQQGAITLSFAAPETISASADAVSLTPDDLPPIKPPEIVPVDVEIQPVRTSLETTLAQATLPAELEAAHTNELRTPKRRPKEEPQIDSSAPVSPTRRVRAIEFIAAAAEVSPPPISQPIGSDAEVPPRKIASNRQPPYPPDAFQRGQQGRLLLEVHLNARGLVETLHVVQSSGVASLDRSALDTVATWRFEPAQRGGRAVAAVVNVPIRFAIR